MSIEHRIVLQRSCAFSWRSALRRSRLVATSANVSTWPSSRHRDCLEGRHQGQGNPRHLYGPRVPSSRRTDRRLRLHSARTAASVHVRAERMPRTARRHQQSQQQTRTVPIWRSRQQLRTFCPMVQSWRVQHTHTRIRCGQSDKEMFICLRGINGHRSCNSQTPKVGSFQGAVPNAPEGWSGQAFYRV